MDKEHKEFLRDIFREFWRNINNWNGHASKFETTEEIFLIAESQIESLLHTKDAECEEIIDLAYEQGINFGMSYNQVNQYQESAKERKRVELKELRDKLSTKRGA